jgi:hypothetical protein
MIASCAHGHGSKLSPWCPTEETTIDHSPKPPLPEEEESATWLDRIGQRDYAEAKLGVEPE